MLVNSSISNSRYRTRIIIFFLSFLALNTLGDLAVAYYVKDYTTAERFIDSKSSKFYHMGHRISDPVDMIFVGSSFAKHHVSTERFREKGFSIYNLGVSGRVLSDYPSMVNRALDFTPRYVVINIQVNHLYEPIELGRLHFDDLVALYRSGQPVGLQASGLFNFIMNSHMLHYLREGVYNRARVTLGGWDIAFGWDGRSAPESDRSESRRYRSQLSLEPDCDGFKLQRARIEAVLTCTNGDGIYFGYVDARLRESESSYLKSINVDTAELMNNIVRKVRDDGSIAIVILTPIWQKRFVYSLSDVRASIEAEVLDLTDRTFSDDQWGDVDHLNYHGRLKYSDLVFSELAEYLDAPEA